MVRVIAVEPFNEKRPGDEFELSDREFAQAKEKRLVKLAAPAKNKMAPRLDNKANPTQAVGEEVPSSASPAGQASPQTIATPSATGRRRGRPPKNAGSSQ